MQQWLRYADLVDRGLVRNRITLGNWIRDCGFPPGRLLGPNTRVWSEQEIDFWIASRPVERKPATMVKPERKPAVADANEAGGGDVGKVSATRRGTGWRCIGAWN